MSMSYEERIEAIARAIHVAHMAEEGREASPDGWGWRLFRQEARAADAACLAAIEEPTSQVVNDDGGLLIAGDIVRKTWAALWSAIPRGTP